MNLYLVQYTGTDSMTQVWAEADDHLDAATSVLIDRGFDSMLHKQDDALVIVVCRDSCIAGSYPMQHVREHADRILGLTTLPDSPPDEADWWRD